MRPTVSNSLRDMQLELLCQFFLGLGVNIYNQLDKLNPIIDNINRKVDMVSCVKAIRAFAKVTVLIPVNRVMTPTDQACQAFIRTLKKLYPSFKLIDSGFQETTAVADAHWVEVIMDSDDGTGPSLAEAKRVYDQIRLIGEAAVRS